MTNESIEHEVRGLDVVLLALALLLTTIGILLVFDASYAFALEHQITQTKYVGQQALWGAVGVVVLLGASHYSFWKWRSWATIGAFGCIVALVMVFVPHIGIAAKGAHRWVGHGAFRLQPSEFAKLFLVLYIARSCAGQVRIMKNFLTGPGPGIVVTAVLAVLTAKEPDLGTSLLLVGTGVATLYFAGAKLKHLAATAACVLALVGGFIAIKFSHGHNSYQLARIMVFLNPEQNKQGDGFQVYHSTVALGTGGLTGRGIGQSREKLNLPEAYTDFIFAVIGEEGGLVTTLGILALLGFVAARGMHIACITRDRFGSILAAGLSFCLGLQALVNIAVVTASIPATGVPLPFISYGGSSLILSLLMVGVLLNIGKNPDGDPNIVRLSSEQSMGPGERGPWRFSGGPGEQVSRSKGVSRRNPAVG
jgi:cell division protein FtsW